jgi:hypothetical protein
MEVHISSDAVYPLCFDASPPAAGASEYLRDPSVRLLVAFFRDRGLEALKQEGRREDWHQDWIDYWVAGAATRHCTSPMSLLEWLDLIPSA